MGHMQTRVRAIIDFSLLLCNASNFSLPRTDSEDFFKAGCCAVQAGQMTLVWNFRLERTHTSL